jgi:hypothetical protein
MPLFYKVAKDHPRLTVDSGEVMIEWSDVVPHIGAFIVSMLGANGREEYASGADHLTPKDLLRVEIQQVEDPYGDTVEQIALYTTVRKNPITYTRRTDGAYYDDYIKALTKYCRRYLIDFYDRRPVEADQKISIW